MEQLNEYRRIIGAADSLAASPSTHPDSRRAGNMNEHRQPMEKTRFYKKKRPRPAASNHRKVSSMIQVNGDVAVGGRRVGGQESDSTIRRLAMMNLAVREIESELSSEYADTFCRDIFKFLRTSTFLYWYL
jgi:hypothetical protein